MKAPAPNGRRRDVAEAIAHLKDSNGTSQLFSHLASRTAHLAGKPLTFLIAVAIVAASLSLGAWGSQTGMHDGYSVTITQLQ